MALRSVLMAVGMPAPMATKFGYDPVQAVTAAGTTQATAQALNTNCASVTTSAINAGVIINQPNDDNYIINAGPNTLTVYPPVGSNFQALAANVGLQVAVGDALMTKGCGTTLLASYAGVV